MIKTIFKKWHLPAIAMLLITAMLGISSTVALAASAPTPIHTDNLVVGGQYTPGTMGTEMDIMLNGGPALPGWCVNENVDIVVSTQYASDIFAYRDYFGESYPAYTAPH